MTDDDILEKMVAYGLMGQIYEQMFPSLRMLSALRMSYMKRPNQATLARMVTTAERIEIEFKHRMDALRKELPPTAPADVMTTLEATLDGIVKGREHLTRFSDRLK